MLKFCAHYLVIWSLLFNTINSVFAQTLPSLPAITYTPPADFTPPANFTSPVISLTPISKTAEVQHAEDMTNSFKESLTPDETSALREIGLTEREINDIENDGNCGIADSNRRVCWSDESNKYVAATVTTVESNKYKEGTSTGFNSNKMIEANATNVESNTPIEGTPTSDDSNRQVEGSATSVESSEKSSSSNDLQNESTISSTRQISLCPGDIPPWSTAVDCRPNGNLRLDLLQKYTSNKIQNSNFADSIYKPMVVPFAATMGLNMFNLFFAAFSAPFLIATCLPLPSTVLHVTNSVAFLVQEVQILGEFNLATDMLTKGQSEISKLNNKDGLEKKIQENVVNDKTKGRDALAKLDQTLDEQLEPLLVLKGILTKSIDYVKKKRRNILISSIGYGLASVAAGIELFTPMSAKTCTVTKFGDAGAMGVGGRLFFIAWLTGVLALIAKFVADKNKDFVEEQKKKGYPVTGYLFDVDKMGMLVVAFVGAAITFGIAGANGFIWLYNTLYGASVNRFVSFTNQTYLATATAVLMMKLSSIYEQRIGFLAHLMDLMIARKDSAIKVGEAWVDGFDSTVNEINNSNNGMFHTENPLDVCTTKEINDGTCNVDVTITLPTPTP